MALSPSSTEEGAVIVAPLVSWSVLPELTKILCEGYDVFCKDCGGAVIVEIEADCVGLQRRQGDDDNNDYH